MQCIGQTINTFADVAIFTVTRFVAKPAVVGKNAPVVIVRFITMPFTIRGVIAVQPVGDVVPRFRFGLVKSYPAFHVGTDIAIIHNGVTSPITDVYYNIGL